MGNDYFERVQALTATRFWINNVTREQTEQALAAGAVGCTQNPSYTWKILNGSSDAEYAETLLTEILSGENDDNAALIALQRELVAGVAKRFLPQYEATDGKCGYVSIQGDPFREDTESIVASARFNRQAGANIMAKIPVTEDGLRAIETLVRERVPINATECMSVGQVLDVCRTYTRACKGITNPAPLYYSLITGIFDEHLKNEAARKEIAISRDALHHAGLFLARKTLELVRQNDYPCGMIIGGARGLHHFTDIVGANAIVTINWRGTADELLTLDGPVKDVFSARNSEALLDELNEMLPDFAKAYAIHGLEASEYETFGPVVLFRSSFETAWKNALQLIGQRRRQLMK